MDSPNLLVFLGENEGLDRQNREQAGYRPTQNAVQHQGSNQRQNRLADQSYN